MPRTPAFQRVSANSPPASASERYSIQDEERNGLEIAEAALGNPERAGQVPFYTGITHSLQPTRAQRRGLSLPKANGLISDQGIRLE